jgi:hypothetical protein
MQSEILYSRYLRKGDVFVHADLQGAVPLIVKNKANISDAPIPPGTLSQAGTLTVATSNAWESKALMGAWWVNADQVSKTAPTGEYLTTSGFIITGEKNFLPPAQLILGFGVLFQISEDSIPNHTKHRVQEQPQAEALESTESVGQEEVPTARDSAEARANQESKFDDGSEESSGLDDEDEERVDNDTFGGYDNPLQTQQARLSKENAIDTLGGDSQGEGEQEQEDSSASQPPDSTQVSDSRAAKHISVRERRLLENGQSGTGNGTSTASAEETTSQASIATNAHSHPSTSSLQQPGPKQPHVRGKKGKNKKFAEKYRHQDEEDRELALRILGSAANADKAAAAAEEKANREAELEAQRKRRRAQHERAAEAERKRQDALRREEEGGTRYLTEACHASRR